MEHWNKENMNQDKIKALLFTRHLLQFASVLASLLLLLSGALSWGLVPQGTASRQNMAMMPVMMMPVMMMM
jgi:hypothetical protein